MKALRDCKLITLRPINLKLTANEFKGHPSLSYLNPPYQEWQKAMHIYVYRHTHTLSLLRLCNSLLICGEQQSAVVARLSLRMFF